LFIVFKNKIVCKKSNRSAELSVIRLQIIREGMGIISEYCDFLKMVFISPTQIFAGSAVYLPPIKVTYFFYLPGNRGNSKEPDPEVGSSADFSFVFPVITIMASMKITCCGV